MVEKLDRYLEGLNEENLKVGVFSGIIELKNLNLKSSALDELDLPLDIIRGSLQTLTVTVPWTQLESKPVKVVIDGLMLLTRPLDVRNLNKKDLEVKILHSRKKKILASDTLILSSIGGDSNSQSGSSTYFQRLTAKILDNLEITITNM